MENKSKLPSGIYEHVLNKAISKELEVNSDDDAVLESIDEEEAVRVPLKRDNTMFLPTGIYEEIISESLKDQLNKLENYCSQTQSIDPEEAYLILSRYTGRVIQRALKVIREGSKIETETLTEQVGICNQLIDNLAKLCDQDDLLKFKISQQHEMLLSLYLKINTIRALEVNPTIIRPESPISESSLFTGATVEPNMVNEIKKEIVTSDRIDIIMSFIRYSGLLLILDELRRFVEESPTHKVRFITTSYMGATEYKALQVLSKIPNVEVKMSFNTTRTRLHAKAYLFERNTGFSTAYIGSSNLSRAAITNGLEWNIKVSERDSFDIIRKFQVTFDSYWNDSEFETVDIEDAQMAKRVRLALMQNQSTMMHKELLFYITPHPYQKEMLDHLEAERLVHGRYKNLLVAATGVGKTVVSAFDYARFAKERKDKPARLLFVAHRKEILEQSLRTFRVILRDQNFGDVFYGDATPNDIDHLFISIQTFNSKAFHQMTTPDFYEFLIVDEFHHAAAVSYQLLLEYYKPQILLGLTATPERMDGKDVFQYFDHYVASEMRLPEAIDRQLLCPFLYFGVADEVDYSALKWSGHYDARELSNIYTVNDHRARLVLEKTYQYLSDISQVKAIGFCATKDHALHMNDFFKKRGLRSEVVISETDAITRAGVSGRLAKGEVNFIFTVDIYNEGVDIPEINTVLFLRPTESMTIFLQQLGRGLRLCTDKDHLTVLDFIGQAHKSYRYEDKFGAIVEKGRHSLGHLIEQEIFKVPKGCYIKLEKMAKEYVLRNLKNVTINARFLSEKVRCFEADTGLELNLLNFLTYYKMSLNNFYGTSGTRSFVSLAERETFVPSEAYFASVKRFKNLFHLNSRRFLGFIVDYLKLEVWKSGFGKLAAGGIYDEALLERFECMLYYSFYSNHPGDEGYEGISQGLANIFKDERIVKEVLEICHYQLEQINFVDEEVDLGYVCPLDLHCAYSRDQLMAGLGEYNGLGNKSFREGVKFLKQKNLDLFLINLNKSEKDFSPSTMYDDYAINSRLFHWQSQSTTSVDSSTGQRYIQHRKLGYKILLFVREYKIENGLAAPYVYLGKANYVKHEGTKPISFVWELEKEMPAKLVVKANKSVM
jgi:superfamily II DNA or RNA helicase